MHTLQRSCLTSSYKSNSGPEHQVHLLQLGGNTGTGGKRSLAAIW